MPDTKKTFDSISKNYDLINQLISFGLHKKWKKDFVNLINFHGDVVDLATGTGDIAISIKEKFPDVKVVGYDPSSRMLEIAKNKNSNKTILFKNGFCENMAFSDSSFNFATITFGIRNTKSIPKSLSEIRRILKENGVLMIMEFSKSDNFVIKNLYNMYLNYIIPIIGLLFSKYDEYKYLATSIESFYSKDEMNEILSKNGFTVDRNVQYNFGLVTIYIVTKS